MSNDIQRYLLEHTRLGISAIFHEESLHGHLAKDATLFPSHLALASTWDTALINEVFSLVTAEVRASGGKKKTHLFLLRLIEIL